MDRTKVDIDSTSDDNVSTDLIDTTVYMTIKNDAFKYEDNNIKKKVNVKGKK